ncbi:MAG: uroporphyrinogen decarboxylase family protein [Cyclobacteriaceae bacterium]|nr:uroporphyrinogen decarboxylase family protein [Cyclobacteriaceae bacterium]
MNGYERIKAALENKPSDKIPIMLHNFLMAAHEAGITMDEFRNVPEKMAGAFIRSVEKYRFDGIMIDMDTVTLAGSLGVSVDFPPNEAARSPRGLLNDLSEIRKLPGVNIENYRYIGHWLEAVRLIKSHFKKEIYVRGNCDQAPFSLACLVRGMENWMTDLYLGGEDQLFELLDYCEKASVRFLRLMSETGCDMLSNGDSPAGPDLLPPELYEKFALPYEKKLADESHRLGLPYALHICGNTELILEKMPDCGADAFELDYKTDTQKAFDMLYDKAVFIGNIDPSGVLAMGTPGMVREKTLKLLRIFSKTNRFILNAGCAIPATTPGENIRTMIETAREFR